MSKTAPRKTAPRIPRINPAVAQGAPTPVGGPEVSDVPKRFYRIGDSILPEGDLLLALRDLLDLYDRHVHGKTKNGKSSESWGVDEVLRLNAIRLLAGTAPVEKGDSK